MFWHLKKLEGLFLLCVLESCQVSDWGRDDHTQNRITSWYLYIHCDASQSLCTGDLCALMRSQYRTNNKTLWTSQFERLKALKANVTHVFTEASNLICSWPLARQNGGVLCQHEGLMLRNFILLHCVHCIQSLFFRSNCRWIQRSHVDHVMNLDLPPSQQIIKHQFFISPVSFCFFRVVSALACL